MVDLDVHSPPYERFDEYGYMSDSDFDTDTEEETDGSLQECVVRIRNPAHFYLAGQEYCKFQWKRP